MKRPGLADKFVVRPHSRQDASIFFLSRHSFFVNIALWPTTDRFQSPDPTYSRSVDALVDPVEEPIWSTRADHGSVL
jgi:hypothetical protein